MKVRGQHIKLLFIWGATVLFLILLIQLANQFLVTWKGAEQFVGPTYGRVSYWVDSGKCARKTGALLAICKSDRKLPIEDVSLADDMGHAFILGILGKYTNVELSKLTLVRVNLVINALGLTVLASMLLYGRMWIAAAILLGWASHVVFSKFITADVWGSYFGVVSLAICLAIWILIASARNPSTFAFAVGIVIGFVSLLVAMALRQPLGIIGVICALAATSIFVKANWKHRSTAANIVVMACLTFCAVVPAKVDEILVSMRATFFDVGPGSKQQSHGISHNLYIGLGSQENPWGIKWDDSYAAQAVSSVRPDVEYVSEEYFDTLWQLYAQRWLEHPGAILRVYGLNAAEILDAPLPANWPDRFPSYTVANGMIWLGVAVCVLALISTLGGHRCLSSIVPVLLLSIMATALVLTQGVITAPYLMFFFPAALLLALTGGLVVEGLLRGASCQPLIDALHGCIRRLDFGRAAG